MSTTSEETHRVTHTPGPWRVGGMGVVIDDRMNAIALPGPGRTIMEQDANARLIAAAPELLSALKEMVKWHGETHQIFCPGDDTCFCQHAEFNHRVNTAIAKAEGRE